MNKFTKNRVIFTTCFIIALSFNGCGKDDDANSTTTSTLSSMIPSIALSSPTAVKSTSAISVKREEHIFQAAAAETELKPMDTVKSEVSAILSTTDVSKCFNGITFSGFSRSISCYGPNLVYQNHPGGSPSGGTSPGCPAGANCLPSGDLGIWSATEGTTGEACAAAQLNALVGDVATSVNNGIKLLAGMVCVAQINEKKLPEISETIDLATEVAAALNGGSVTTAKLSRESNYTGTENAVYKVEMTAKIDNIDVSLTLKHSPANSGTDFKGILYGTVGVNSSSMKGFSVVYSQSDSTLTYLAKSATTKLSTNTSELFDSNGNYKYTTFLAGGGGNSDNSNARYLLASVNKDSGLGTLQFAWQAGGADSKSRVFNVHATANSGVDDTGFAYFGFGPSFSSDTTLGSIGGMCCNWAGPGGTCMASSNYDKASYGQSQVFSRNSSGVFIPTASNITYAPTNSCDHASATTFKYATISEWGSNGSSISAASVTNNLTTLTAAGTIPSITAPTF